jgi:hypothetical protein
MAMNRERLGKEVGKVKQGGDVGKGKQALANSIPEPVKTHVHRFGLFRTDSSMSKTNRTFIVTKQGSWGLGVANVLEGSTEETGGFGVAKGGSELGLSGRGDNNRDTGGNKFYSGVGERGVVVTQNVVATGFRAGIGEAEVGSVGLGLEQHGGWADDLDSIGMGLGVAEKACHGVKGSDCGAGLEAGEGGSGGEEEGINDTGIVEHGANLLTQAFGLGRGSGSRGVNGENLGGGTTILGRYVEGGGGSWAETIWAEAFEHSRDVVGHREGDQAAVSVVGDSTSKEVSSDGGGFNVVVGVEASNEAVKVSRVCILNTKIVNYKSKIDIVSVMGKQTGLDLVVARRFK